MASDIAIRLENVSVGYVVPSERIGTFKEYIIRWVQRKVKTQTFWALKDVTLNIEQGEVLGIIGQNGAGKSTLLKLIARVIRPNAGRVWVRGRVAPLLELGAGFHPELTGRENIYLNGAMLGYTRKQLDHKVGSIIEFSELQDFIDAPMRTYSTGMWARLGFAVATDAQPEILIVDEILSVGDEAFQQKCLNRIRQFREYGTTILIVTHTMGMIEGMCDRAVWLSHGEMKAQGDVKHVINAYRKGQDHF
jgi:ABC-2 type transport system ATP-binding protein